MRRTCAFLAPLCVALAALVVTLAPTRALADVIAEPPVSRSGPLLLVGIIVVVAAIVAALAIVRRGRRK